MKGFITLDSFDRLGGKIVNSNERDHLYAKSEISLNNWIFLTQNIDHKKNKQIINLSKNDICVLPQETLAKFFMLVKILSDRLILLNYQ